MLIKINNRKIVDTQNTPVIVLFEPREIAMIKNWNQGEDILFSRPSRWESKDVDKWMDKKKPELVALNKANAAAEEAKKGKPKPVTCIHGVVHKEDSPGCPECKKIAKAMGVEERPFGSTAEIEQIEKGQNGIGSKNGQD